MSLKDQILNDMKAAMRSGDKTRLGVIRLIASAIKQREVDERITLDDSAVIAILEKMIKQRRDSVSQFQAGGRPELADVETAEIVILQGYLPAALSEAEIDAIIDSAVTESGASSVKDMGKVMGLVKPKVQGRADMGAVSGKIKAKLAG
ncbi:MAG: GatB/YqeY domain-containing protein [Nevskiales bacterium]